MQPHHTASAPPLTRPGLRPRARRRLSGLAALVLDVLIVLLCSCSGGQARASSARNARIIANTHTDSQNPMPKDYRIIPPEDLGGFVYKHHSIRGSVILTLDIPRGQVLVGARNYLIRLRLDNLGVLEEHKWVPRNSTREICLLKGHPEEICHNFVRVLLLHKDKDKVTDKVFSCGTNAFKPECTWRNITDLSQVYKRHSGVAICPYSYHDNSTTVMTKSGDLYSSTFMDPIGREPGIYRVVGTSPHLRTVHSAKWLNDPDFVAVHEMEDYIYFFFRETAVEYVNCGKVIYSRVARVCKSDTGGNLVLRENWTTFVKARLNCSRRGNFPFYYDEIQSVFYQEKQKTFFAVFSTSPNSIAGSAVCGFSLRDLDRAFKGPYKYQSDSSSAWRSVPNPNPSFKCQSNAGKRSRSASPQRILLEAQRYQLMAHAVQAQLPSPYIAADNERWSHLVIDFVTVKHHGELTVMFVASVDGTIKKIVNLPRSKGTCVVEELQISARPVSIKSLKIHANKGKILVGTEGRIFSIPVERCDRFQTRDMCLNAKDPYCGWDKSVGRCKPPARGQHQAHHWHQNINACPILKYPVDGGWTSWTEWTDCPHIGDGRDGDRCLCRMRSCSDPEPLLGGKPCDGPSLQITNCTVNGGWTPWSDWSACSQSCDVAIRTRHRSCTNPAPKFGGRVCVGATRDEEYCHKNPPCPVPTRPPIDGNWSPWTDYSECSTPCGGGVQKRYRTCTEPPPADGGAHCAGNDEQWRICNDMECAEVKKSTAWTPWVKTNSTRDGFYQERFRFVCKANVAESGHMRVSNMKSETRFCKEKHNKCNNGKGLHIPDMDGGWSLWSGWTQCNAPCGSGTQWRRRQCNAPYPSGGGRDCEGHGLEVRECNVHSCEGMWSCWTAWSPCSKSCGSGTRWRSRQCVARVQDREFNIPCQGKDQQTEDCNMSLCGGFDGWEEWTLWSECTVDRVQSRKRNCKLAFPDEHQCKGKTIETRMCSYNVIPNVSIGEVQHRGEQRLSDGGSPGGFQLIHMIAVGVVAFMVGSFASVGICLFCQRRHRAKGQLRLKHLEKRENKPSSTMYNLGNSHSNVSLGLNNSKPNFYDTSSLKKDHKYMTVKEAAMKRNSLLRTSSMRTNLSLNDL